MSPKIIELFVHFSEEELEILMAEYKDELALKFAVSRLLNKEIAKHCEQITMGEKWVMRNSITESDDSGEAV